MSEFGLPENIKLPKYFKGASPYIKGLWVLREKLKIEWNNHPKRFYTVTNKEGEEAIFDCKMGNSRIAIQMHKFFDTEGVTEKEWEVYNEMIKEAQGVRNMFQTQYATKIGGITRKLNKIIGAKSELSILDTREDEILTLFGKFYSDREVLEYINNEYGWNINHQTLEAWLKRNESRVEKKKAEYVLKNKDFRIATDAGRMDVLNEQLTYWQSKFNKKQSESISRVILNVLEQARREIKGNQLTLTVDGKIDISATLHGKDNIIEISRRLPINMLIIALVASKQHIEPINIMTQLATSFYGDFNGFNGNILENKEVDSPLNLIKNYNFEELRQKNEVYTKTQYKQIEEAEVVETNEIDLLKNKTDLLKSLKNLGENLL